MRGPDQPSSQAPRGPFTDSANGNHSPGQMPGPANQVRLAFSLSQSTSQHNSTVLEHVLLENHVQEAEVLYMN